MIYEANGVMMIEEKTVGGSIVNRFYSEKNCLKIEVFENQINVSVYDYLGNANIDYKGDVVITVDDVVVSRETLINGMVAFDMSESEIGIYELVISCEGLRNEVLTYEKN